MEYEQLYAAFMDVQVGDAVPSGTVFLDGEWICIERTDTHAATAFVFQSHNDQQDMFLHLLPRFWVVVSHISRAKIVMSGIYAELPSGEIYGNKTKACDLWQQHRLDKKLICK